MTNNGRGLEIGPASVGWGDDRNISYFADGLFLVTGVNHIPFLFSYRNPVFSNKNLFFVSKKTLYLSCRN